MWRTYSCLPGRDSGLLISWNEDALGFEPRFLGAFKTSRNRKTLLAADKRR
jgi:hypothetical protein